MRWLGFNVFLYVIWQNFVCRVLINKVINRVLSYIEMSIANYFPVSVINYYSKNS